jgi:hypothetical protein
MASLDIDKTKELILKDNIPLQFESCTFEIFLQQLRIIYSLKKDEKTLLEATKKVEEFFERMKSLNTIKNDFKKIYGRELNG